MPTPSHTAQYVRQPQPLTREQVVKIGQAMLECCSAIDNLRTALDAAGCDGSAVAAALAHGQDKTFDVIDRSLCETSPKGARESRFRRHREIRKAH